MELISDYDSYSERTRKSIANMNENAQMNTINTPCHTHSLLDCCQAATVPALCKGNKMPNKKQEKTMYNDLELGITTQAPEERKAQYLIDQLWNAESNAQTTLWHDFWMNGPDEPKNPKEFMDRIKAGQYKFNKDYLNEDGTFRTPEDRSFDWYSPKRYFEWDIPDQKTDRDGYTAAMKELRAAKTKAERTITIGTPDEGLKALQDFESQTFH